MRYAIEGIDPATRRQRRREVVAGSEEEAVRLAGGDGIAVKRVYRVPDDAPPFGTVSPESQPPAAGCAPLLAVCCFFVAILALIGGLLLAFLRGKLAIGVAVIIIGALFLNAGALFFIIKLLNVIAKGGTPRSGK